MVAAQEASFTERATALARRVQARNSLGRRVLVVTLGDLSAILHAALPATSGNTLSGTVCLISLQQLAQSDPGFDTVRRDLIDQVIIVAPIEHDVVETQTLCLRCAQEGVKVGAILIDTLAVHADGRFLADTARRYAETIAITSEVDTVTGILTALGA